MEANPELQEFELGGKMTLGDVRCSSWGQMYYDALQMTLPDLRDEDYVDDRALSTLAAIRRFETATSLASASVTQV
jgi:hypothetical protein